MPDLPKTASRWCQDMPDPYVGDFWPSLVFLCPALVQPPSRLATHWPGEPNIGRPPKIRLTGWNTVFALVVGQGGVPVREAVAKPGMR